MWQCQRCDSEVEPDVPGCARCPIRVDGAALAQAAASPLFGRAAQDEEAAKATAIVAAAVIGIRYDDTAPGKGKTIWYMVDLAFEHGPPRSFKFRTPWSSKASTPEGERLGQIVLVFLRDDVVADWWPIAEGPIPVAPVNAIDRPAPSIPGVPSGRAPLVKPDGTLVGVPLDELRGKLAAASTHPQREAAMTAPLPRTLDIEWGDLLGVAIALFLIATPWVVAQQKIASGEKTWDDVPGGVIAILVAVSSLGLLMLALYTRSLVKQLRAPIIRVPVGVVDARATEDGETRVGRATLVFEDGAVRDYKLLRPARAGATAGAVGIACFRQDYVMAFFPLTSS